MNSLPAIWNKKALMARIDNDDELLEDLAAYFIKDIDKNIELLETLLQKGDADSAKKQAHVIKGMCANIGGERAQALALKIELSVQQNVLSVYESDFSSLCKEILMLKEIISTSRTAKSKV